MTLRNCQLPPESEILTRVFNTPEKKRRLANEVLFCEVQHVHKILRGAVRSDLGRVCAAITLAATFPDESWEPEGESLRRAGLLADYVREHYLLIVEMDSPPYSSERDRVAHSLDILREAQQAVEALSLNKPTAETLTQLVKLRDITEQAITRFSNTPEEETV